MNLADASAAWGNLPSKVDVLVVGGGLAGLELARHLDVAGTDTLVVEAGPANDLRHINEANKPVRAEEIWTDVRSDEYFAQPWRSRTHPHFGDGAGLRRRLGGRSLYWHGVLLPVEGWALCEPWWPRTVIDDLTRSWLGGPSLYDVVRTELLGWGTATARPSTLADVGGFCLAPPPRAIRPVDSGEGRWRAYTPLSHWTEAESRGVARIAPMVEVLGIKVEGRRAVGATVSHDGATRTIRAAKTVLAAGTVESTRLAIQALMTAGCLARPALPGLVDHIVQGFNVTADATQLPSEHFFWYAPGIEGSRSNLFVEGVPGPAGGIELEVWATGEQSPSNAGEVCCEPTCAWPWPVLVSSALSGEDRRVAAAQRSELQRFWDALCSLQGRDRSVLDFEPDFAAPTRTLRGVRAQLRENRPPNRFPAPVTWSSPLGTEDHEGGTLAIGSVLNDRHELTGVPGLFAAGPATFPRQGAANPSLTTLALARRLAEVLIA